MQGYNTRSHVAKPVKVYLETSKLQLHFKQNNIILILLKTFLFPNIILILLKTQSAQLKFDESRIWLLVYDLHLRNFDDRDSMDRIRQQDLYESVHVQGKTQKRNINHN